MEATWLGFKLWSAAVAAAGTTDVDAVRAALRGLEMPAPSGFTVRVDAADQHLHKPAFIGCMTADGRLLPVWKSAGLLPPQPWSAWLLPDGAGNKAPLARAS
jgi:urea transport system substrate-binding protein